MRPLTIRFELTVVLQRDEKGEGFTALVAELPDLIVHGMTLAAARDAIRGQLVPFLIVNRDIALDDLSDGALLETIVLAERRPEEVLEASV